MTMLTAVRCLLSLPVIALIPGCVSHSQPGTAPAYIAKGRTLRIMALGDSITRGSGNGYGNYRRPLQALLTQGGYHFRFVGENTEQSFNYHGFDHGQTFSPYQPNHEGYGGFRIDQIAADSPAKDDGGVSYSGLSHALATGQPEVILLMLGTNDVNQAYDPGGPGYAGGTGFAADAAQRLDTLLDRIFKACPDLTLVVATITPLDDAAKEAQARAYNAFLPQIVAAHRKRGQNVLFADMHTALTTADLSPDGVHPGTFGYNKMAGTWYRALTGQSAPIPSPVWTPPHEAGDLAEHNLFSQGTKVVVSDSFASKAFSGGNLVDSTDRAFVFRSADNERVAISGFHGSIGRLRFFDTPSYAGRTPSHVTIYYAASVLSSLDPDHYTKLGTFSLSVIGDSYENQTQPPAHPAPTDPASRPGATIDFCDLDRLSIPTEARSILLDFSKNGGDGDGLTEIQAFAPGDL